AYLFLLRTYYARGNARTPFLINVIENLINIVLAIALVHRFGVGGLITAYSVAYLAAAAITYVLLRRDIQIGSVLPTIGRCLAAGVGMLAVGQLIPSTLPSSPAVRIASLVGWTIAVGAAYVGILFMLKAPELKLVLLLRRNRQGVVE
ncbi:MAG: lipid II flippase MurJ, partial [Acidimicrobiia bacterium]